MADITMNRKDIRDMARKRLGETTAAFWSDDELNGWINKAIKDIAFRSKVLKDNMTVTATADTAQYTLSALFPRVHSILEAYVQYLTGKWIKLKATSRTDLDIQFPGWLGAPSSACSTHYYWDSEEDVFFLYPPMIAPITDGLKIYYTYEPEPMLADTDVSEMPDHLNLAIVDFVVATGFDTRGWTDKANDAWSKCYQRIKDYTIEHAREREDDNVISRNYRHIGNYRAR